MIYHDIRRIFVIPEHVRAFLSLVCKKFPDITIGRWQGWIVLKYFNQLI